MPLTLESVSYTYRIVRDVAGTSALSEVDLIVERGELVVVVGATGSGKTTLMKLAAGLLAPDSGSVSLDGSAPSPGRGGVGLIFQDAESQLFADSVVEDVAFGPRNQGMAPEAALERARTTLSAVGLESETWERSPFTLSGGEARRAAIAGVLALEPRYLLADEPTAGLDARGRRAVRDLVLAQRDRAGVVVVTHAAEEFLGDADRLLVLDDGASVWAGAADEAVSHPEQLFAAGVALPDVLEVQRRAVEAGFVLNGYSLDPITAAASLAAAERGR